MKKIICLLLILSLVFCFAGCGGNGSSDGDNTSEDKPVELVLGSTTSGEATNPYTMQVAWANEWLTEHESTVSIAPTWGSVLGSETEMTQNIALGTSLDIAMIADMSTNGVVPKIAFANFPGLFKNYDDVAAGWGQDGWAYNLASSLFEEAGIKLLAASDNGFRIITNSVRPITCLDDIKGLKIRVPENTLLLDIWGELGAQATPIALGDLTAALQQGVVDGQELGVQHFYGFGWVEFQKYMTLLNYDYSANVMIMNSDKFNSLSEKQQSDLLEACNYAAAKEREYAVEYMDNALEDMQNHGLELLQTTEEMQQGIYDIGVKLAYSDYWMGILGEDLVKQIYPQ